MSLLIMITKQYFKNESLAILALWKFDHFRKNPNLLTVLVESVRTHALEKFPVCLRVLHVLAIH